MGLATTQDLHTAVLEYNVRLEDIALKSGYSKAWVFRTLKHGGKNEDIIRTAIELVQEKKNQREELKNQIAQISNQQSQPS